MVSTRSHVLQLVQQAVRIVVRVDVLVPSRSKRAWEDGERTAIDLGIRNNPQGSIGRVGDGGEFGMLILEIGDHSVTHNLGFNEPGKAEG